MATERQEKSPAPDRVKMLDRFEKLDDALAAECVLVLVNLKVGNRSGYRSEANNRSRWLARFQRWVPAAVRISPVVKNLSD